MKRYMLTNLKIKHNGVNYEISFIPSYSILIPWVAAAWNTKKSIGFWSSRLAVIYSGFLKTPPKNDVFFVVAGG